MSSTPPPAERSPTGRADRRWRYLLGVLVGVLIVAAVVVVAVTDGPRPHAAAEPGIADRTAAAGTAATPSGTVVVAAAGDIACDPTDDGFGDGTGTPEACHQTETAAVVDRIAPQAVLALGDIQYVQGTPDNYAASYTPSWGRFKDITHPAIGNHEGGEGGSNRQYFAYFGAAAGDRDKGYYSLDLGAWHLVALNSNCGRYSFNGSNTGCAAGSAQDRWLQADLAAHRSSCTLAYFHVPRFSSGSGHHSDATTDRTLTTLWRDLYAAHVDLVLNGHAHDYERFEPLTPDGVLDAATGIREFVVGTGGDNHQRFAAAVVPGSAVRNADTFGVLRLALRPGGYDWQFLSDDGGTAVDSGSASCHGR